MPRLRRRDQRECRDAICRSRAARRVAATAARAAADAATLSVVFASATMMPFTRGLADAAGAPLLAAVASRTAPQRRSATARRFARRLRAISPARMLTLRAAMPDAAQIAPTPYAHAERHVAARCYTRQCRHPTR